MSLSVNIEDGNGTRRTAHLFSKEGAWGIVAYTQNMLDYTNRISALSNATFGVNMNIDASFSGTPTGIHDGEDSTLWTASEIVGSKATFNNTDTDGDLPISGSQQIHWNQPLVDDEIQFLNSSGLDMSNYSSFTMKVLVDNNWSEGDSVILFAWDSVAAQQVGDSVGIENYFNFNNFDVIQNVVIPLSDMNIAGETGVDAFRMKYASKQGAPVNFYMDVLQLESSSGGSTEFLLTPARDTIFNIKKLVFSFADVGTGGAAYAYDKLGALPALQNGITLRATSDSKTVINFIFKDLKDILNRGGTVINSIDDGTNTYTTIELPVEIKMDSRKVDEISAVVSDDVSGLSLLQIYAVGLVQTL